MNKQSRLAKSAVDNSQLAIENRRGAVAVEFAVVAPILVAIMFGLIELGRAFEMTNQLEVAAREGARFAAMDRDGMLQEGQSTNAKLIDDVKSCPRTASHATTSPSRSRTMRIRERTSTWMTRPTTSGCLRYRYQSTFPA